MICDSGGFIGSHLACKLKEGVKKAKTKVYPSLLKIEKLMAESL